MLRKNGDTALLLFIRSAREEAKVKTFSALAGRKTNRHIARKLNRYVIRQARRTGLPLYIISDTQQEGNSFGERLANAFERVFAKGYEKVLAMGNDCLSLDAHRMQLAALELQQSELVLGPATDGGAYLIGMHRRIFHHRDFRQLAWQSADLWLDFQKYARQRQVSAVHLPEAADADDPQTFYDSLRSAHTPRWLRLQLNSLLQQPADPHFAKSPLYLSSPYCLSPFYRGPPILS